MAFFTGLCKALHEFQAHDRVEVMIVTDGDVMLSADLEKTKEIFTKSLIAIHLSSGQNTLISSVNLGFDYARKTDLNVLLLLPKTLVSANFLDEMSKVLKKDEMLGFVNPRTSSGYNILGEVKTLEAFEKVKDLLPPYQYRTSIDPSCVLIRNSIIKEFGNLDTLYTSLANSIVDLMMKANRCGWSTAVSNQAFVVSDAVSEPDPLIFQRYPEFAANLESSLNHPETTMTNLIGKLANSLVPQKTICFDLRNLTLLQNGTFRITAQILQKLVPILRAQGHEVFAWGSSEAIKFHKLNLIFQSKFLLSPSETPSVYSLVKLGQPFTTDEFLDAATQGIKIYYTMLDTIAWDCLALRTSHLDHLWFLTAKLANGIFFISQFALEQFKSRFSPGKNTRLTMSGLSLKYKDYLPDAIENTVSDGSGLKWYTNPVWEKRILIFGNSFEHKFLLPTVEKICNLFPETAFLVIGIDLPQKSNTYFLKSGEIAQSQLDQIFGDTDFVIFPSMAEGFGLPIVESLSRGHTIFARETSLNSHVKNQWHGPGNLSLYRDTADLIKKLREYDTISPKTFQDRGTKAFGILDVANRYAEVLTQPSDSISDFEFACSRLRIVSNSTGYSRQSRLENKIHGFIQTFFQGLKRYPTLLKLIKR